MLLSAGAPPSLPLSGVLVRPGAGGCVCVLTLNLVGVSAVLLPAKNTTVAISCCGHHHQHGGWLLAC